MGGIQRGWTGSARAKYAKAAAAASRLLGCAALVTLGLACREEGTSSPRDEGHEQGAAGATHSARDAAAMDADQDDAAPTRANEGERDAAVAADADADTDAAPLPRVESDAGSLPATIDERLALAIRRHALTGDPASPRGLHQIKPADDPLVRLGQLLFNSQTLAGGFDSSCGTCHDVDFGGADGLSLAVGVASMDSSIVGPGRRVDPSRDLDPRADGGPNMHRNTPTTFNAALFDRNLFLDGRVFVLDHEVAFGGVGQEVRTPEEGASFDASGTSGLLEPLLKLPLITDSEMRGFSYVDVATNDAYRERILDRLRGVADTGLMASGSAQRWLELFRTGFHNPSATAADLITTLNVQRALAAFIKSQIFVDSPWSRYVRGEPTAIDEEAKRGALLFLGDAEQGGLGCASCHDGDRFTNEGFANVGFPQIGRGFLRSDGRDVGRWAVTREQDQWMSFRVPSLLNVALTAPYGHAGTFATLEQVLRYHVNPRKQVEAFDFSLQHLQQFAGSGIAYPKAQWLTHEALDNASFAANETTLLGRDLSDDELAELEAFLSALSDDCAADALCRAAWRPAPSLDPDGHMIVPNQSAAPPYVNAARPGDYVASVSLDAMQVTPRTTFSDVLDCPDGIASSVNTNQPVFENHTGEAAFVPAPHGFDATTWLYEGSVENVQSVMFAGGVTALYLEGDCWPDLAFAGGDASGLVFYRSRGQQLGYSADASLIDPTLRAELGTRYTGIATADLDGDYRRELVLGNVLAHPLPILATTDSGAFRRIAELAMTRNTYGIAFGIISPGDYPSMYLAHWSFGGAPGTSPALFANDAGKALRPADLAANTGPAVVDQRHNFTPAFVDLDGDGRQDLAIASDSRTSQLLRNNGDARFNNSTVRSIISDENGMGSALGDYDNDGRQDWFVTSILDPLGVPALGTGGVTGNRLYRNVSVPGKIAVEDVTEQAGVRDGNWGWGACTDDFDQDGFLDIFHVNGFGALPGGVGPLEWIKHQYDATTSQFQGQPSRLFMNQGDGTFVERASAWKIDAPSEGRGVACFDYDRDGDVDIVLVDQSTGLQFFENEIGHGPGRRFVDVRVVGASPNTDALGARIEVVADVGRHGMQTQLRVSNANNNFNGQSLPNSHFGLGSATKILSLTVRWLDDPTPLVCHDLAVNQFLVFDQRNKHCPR